MILEGVRELLSAAVDASLTSCNLLVTGAPFPIFEWFLLRCSTIQSRDHHFVDDCSGCKSLSQDAEDPERVFNTQRFSFAMRLLLQLQIMV